MIGTTEATLAGKTIRHMRRTFTYRLTLEDGRRVWQAPDGYLYFTNAK